MRKRILHFVGMCLLLAPFSVSLVFADKVHLKDGRVLEGEVVEEKDGRIRLKMALGAVWIERSEIVRIEKVPSPRDVYEKRKIGLSKDDASGWLELGDFCLKKGLEREAEACFRASLKADPSLEDVKARLDAIHASWTLNGLFETEDPDEVLRRIFDLVHLGETGKRAAVEALMERERNVFRLAKAPRPVIARIGNEFRRLRDRIRHTVMNEQFYRDSATETKARVEARVASLRAMFEDPAGLETLSLYPPLARWIEEISRLKTALRAFGSEPEDGFEKKAPAVALLQKVLRKHPFLRDLNPFGKINREISESNQKEAERLSLSGTEWEGARAVNDYREMLGLNRLRIDPALCRAARDHSRAMSEKNFFSHDSPIRGFTTPYARIRKAGYDFKIAGENIARRKDGLTSQEALDAWIASPGHHRNLLVPDFEDMGLGVHGIHWTLNLARKRKERK